MLMVSWAVGHELAQKRKEGTRFARGRRAAVMCSEGYQYRGGYYATWGLSIEGPWACFNRSPWTQRR